MVGLIPSSRWPTQHELRRISEFFHIFSLVFFHFKLIICLYIMVSSFELVFCWGELFVHVCLFMCLLYSFLSSVFLSVHLILFLLVFFFYFQDYFIEKKRKKESAELEGCQIGENLGREKGGKMESDHTE